MPPRVQRVVRSLALAQACARLGARVNTIHLLTGMPLPDIKRLFFIDSPLGPRGHPPDSVEWYHTTNLPNRLHACIFASVYVRLLLGGVISEDALIGAYKSYQSVCPPPHRISFDRAFYLAAYTDASQGRLLANSAAFSVVTCPRCASDHLTSIGPQTAGSDDCPFCKLVQRYGRNSQLRRSFPTPTPTVDSEFLVTTVNHCAPWFHPGPGLEASVLSESAISESAIPASVAPASALADPEEIPPN